MMVEHSTDLKVLCRIGEGGCGRVYLVEDRDGERLALKRYDESAVNLVLLEQMTRRLAAGGWPAGLLPVIRVSGGAGPGGRLSPLLADLSGGLREPVPLSLQHRLDEPSGDGSWQRVKAIARALADMHQRGVAHGNLKPGNVFIDPGGEVLLSDWTLGNMPGVRVFHFTDALLYQPPEQLRNPGGYRSPDGFRWDVFAFGVLAYRILTGKFPRCDSVYSQVAPPAGTNRRQDLHVDVLKVARNLESQGVLPWPDCGPLRAETALRECIDRCLSLDPADRPMDMERVAAELERIESTRLDSFLEEAAEPLWSHIHPIRATGLEASKEDRVLSERDLWDLDEEMDWIEAPGPGLPETPVEAASPQGRPGTADDRSGPVPQDPGKREAVEAWEDPPEAEAREPQAADWLEGESADWEKPAESRRKSRVRERMTAPEPASSPAGVRRSRAWSVGDWLGVSLLAVSLAACAGIVFAQSIRKLPEKPDALRMPAFPIAGDRIQLESATCYWRAPVTEGPHVDTCRRDTYLLPVLEVSVAGGTSMIRVQFRNEDGKTTGDPLIRTVSAGEKVRLAGTAGLEDRAAWADYRLGGRAQWSVQIHEIPSSQRSGGGSRELLRMNVPGSLR